MSDASHEDREYVVIDGAKYYRTEGITAYGWMTMLIRAHRIVPADVLLEARREVLELDIRPGAFIGDQRIQLPELAPSATKNLMEWVSSQLGATRDA